MDKEEMLKIFPSYISANLREVPDKIWNEAREIRFRVNRPVIFSIANLRDYIYGGINITTDDLTEILTKMCDNSIYAVTQDIINGFITIKGGHRVGIVGEVILQGNKITNVKNFSSINIRIAHEIKGVADQYIDKIVCGNKVKNTLIVSAPGGGKTTLLRDIVRRVSTDKPGVTVGLVDERSEIAACMNGIPQNDIGLRTDVIDSSPKAQGIELLVRSMSPKVIATDEIFSIDDAESILSAIASGVKVICTTHGTSIEDIQKKRGISKLLNEHIFENLIFL